MLNQFFGRTFLITLSALCVFFVLSIPLFFAGEVVSLIALTCIGIAVFCLSIWRLELGLMIVFAELFANSHGYLLFSSTLPGPVLSLRITLFLAVMCAWPLYLLHKRPKIHISDTFLPVAPAMLAAAIGFLIGVQYQPLRDVFSDGNAYLYFAYVLPILSIPWSSLHRKQLLEILLAAGVYVGILSVGILYVFSHFPEWMLHNAYTMLRDTRTAEITRISDGIFRVFLQAQFFSLIAMLFFSALTWVQQKLTHREFLITVGIMSILLSGLLISLSRSFWLGAVSAAGFLLILGAWWGIKKHHLARSVGLVCLSVVASVLFLVGTVWFPYPNGGASAGNLGDAFGSRAGQDVAISSRWKLLPVMMDAVKERPILGNGFGKTVSFETDDPRAAALSEDGLWTTYSMEWGWLELWLKMGILGPLAFLWLGGFLVWRFWSWRDTPHAWLGAAAISSIVFLFTTHIFSPYLNHPIGIGWLMVLLILSGSKMPHLALREKVELQLDELRANKPLAQPGILTQQKTDQ